MRARMLNQHSVCTPADKCQSLRLFGHRIVFANHVENRGANLVVTARLVAGTSEHEAAIADSEAKRWMGELPRLAFGVSACRLETYVLWKYKSIDIPTSFQ